MVVALYTIATSLIILLDSTVCKRRMGERNDGCYQLIQEKVAHGTYQVLILVVSALFRFAAGIHALQGKDIQVSLFPLSIVLVAFSVSTNQIPASSIRKFYRREFYVETY